MESLIARRSAATSGYFAASFSTSPISTSAGTTPAHSGLAPRNQRRRPSRAGAGMERVGGNEQLPPPAPAQVGADNDPFGGAAVMQKQDLERVAEIVVV